MLGALAAPAEAAQGDIFTFAGTGLSGFGGDGGPATSAALRQPTAVAWLADGSVLVADYGNHRIRRVSPSGQMTTVAGTGTAGYSGDGGPATSARLSWPLDVEPTADGGFLIADLGNKRVRKVSPAGIITTVAGNGVEGASGDGGPATSAQLAAPTGVAVAADGGFLVVDAATHRVRRVSPGGTITRVAGSGQAGGAGDGGSAATAQLNTPVGVEALPDGGFLVTEYEGQRVRRVSAAGMITRAAGSGSAGFSGDGGPATAARLNKPVGVSTTSDGGFLIGDSLNGRVRKVAADGTISTVAGTTVRGYAGDGGLGAAGAASLPCRRGGEHERRDPHRGQRRQPAAPDRRPPVPRRATSPRTGVTSAPCCCGLGARHRGEGSLPSRLPADCDGRVPRDGPAHLAKRGRAASRGGQRGRDRARPVLGGRGRQQDREVAPHSRGTAPTPEAG